jgi:hypothetical protein
MEPGEVAVVAKDREACFKCANCTIMLGLLDPGTGLTPHGALVAFVTSDASSAQQALQNTAISAAEGKVIAAIAIKTLPIPLVGALPVEGALRVLGKFRKHVVKGFDAEYVQGLSSETVVQPGQTGFTIPAGALQGASPLLLRIKPSTKDSARIARSFHVSFKMTGSQMNPATMEVLGTEQETIPCHPEPRPGGEVILTPNTPLASGEYAIVPGSHRPSGANAPVGLVWDFSVQ